MRKNWRLWREENVHCCRLLSDSVRAWTGANLGGTADCERQLRPDSSLSAGSVDEAGALEEKADEVGAETGCGVSLMEREEFGKMGKAGK